jgi:lantibiotic biosynthesis dehydratase-like protein
MPHPDPVLTASLYSNRGLDGLVHGVVAPFRARLAERDPDGRWSLWWVRYSRGGEHLKLRLHGPQEGRELARELLARAAEAHFAALPPADPDAPRVSRPDAPAVDVEDEAAEDRPDRTLLWTQYRRSHVNLGPPVYLRHDGYVERFTACLAAGAELVLDQLHPDAGGKVAGAARQRVLLRGVFTGLGALGFSPEQRAAYLAYHRDWLLRFSLSDTEKETALREHFDRRVDGLAAIVDQLRRASATEWEVDAAPASGVEGRWRAALAGLMAWLEPFRGDPEYLVDPFTDDAACPAVFKVFHALANHLGVGMLDESFTHHLLLRVATPAPAEPVAELAGVA